MNKKVDSFDSRGNFQGNSQYRVGWEQPSTKVKQPPGGFSSISFGDGSNENQFHKKIVQPPGGKCSIGMNEEPQIYPKQGNIKENYKPEEKQQIYAPQIIQNDKNFKGISEKQYVPENQQYDPNYQMQQDIKQNQQPMQPIEKNNMYYDNKLEPQKDQVEGSQPEAWKYHKKTVQPPGGYTNNIFFQQEEKPEKPYEGKFSLKKNYNQTNKIGHEDYTFKEDKNKPSQQNKPKQEQNYQDQPSTNQTLHVKITNPPGGKSTFSFS